MAQQESVVLFPTFGLGHLIPIVELAKQFVAHGFSVTIAVPTTPFDPPTIDPFVSGVTSAYPSMSFHRLPKVTPAASKSLHPFHFETLRLSSAHLLDLLKTIRSASNIRALVLDMFCIPGLDVGNELRIPTYFFYPSNAVALAGFVAFPCLQSKIEGSFRDLGGCAKVNLPGIPPIAVADLPDCFADRDETNEDLVLQLKHLWRADGFMVNTFEWLEKRAVEALRDGAIVPGWKRPPVYCIGPLIADGSRGGERHECLTWLDDQPERSVVYVCFGSSGFLPTEHVRGLALGLERSGQRFLWVVRGLPAGPDLSALLPEGFLERTRMRGMLLKSWAPQTAVLSHAATGAFLSHCGWNSSLEAVTAGVPVIGWPQGADQGMNKHMLVEEAKMAVAIEKSGTGMVSAVEVERKIRLLMESEEGRVIRNRAAEGKKKAAAAWKEDGSTTLAWLDLVRALRN